MQTCAIYTIPPFHIQFALKLACCWEHEQQFSFIYNSLTPLPPSCTLPVTLAHDHPTSDGHLISCAAGF